MNQFLRISDEVEEILLELDTDEEVGILFLALIDYILRKGEPKNFTGTLRMAFIAIRQMIDKDNQR